MSSKHFMKGAAIGALLASVATLFLAPKSGKKTRTDAQKLVNSLTKKIGKQLESLTDLSKESYEDLVARSIKEYGKGKKLTQEFLDEITSLLKNNWKEIQKEIKKK